MQACRRAGLRSSPGGFLQNELVKRQIGDRLAKPVVLELKLLQPLYLFDRTHPSRSEQARLVKKSAA